MGYAAAAPAYSPNMYPGANPTFQAGMQGHMCWVAKSVLLMWLWENAMGMNFKKSGYRIGIWGLYWFPGS